MTLTWSNSLGKVCFLGLRGIQVLKVTYISCLGKVFESLTNKIQISGVSGFSFWAIEPIWKAGNNGKFKKPYSVAN